jgi:predicted SprT family Zn-dependent metalloprotease
MTGNETLTPRSGVRSAVRLRRLGTFAGPQAAAASVTPVPRSRAPALNPRITRRPHSPAQSDLSFRNQDIFDHDIEERVTRTVDSNLAVESGNVPGHRQSTLAAGTRTDLALQDKSSSSVNELEGSRPRIAVSHHADRRLDTEVEQWIPDQVNPKHDLPSPKALRGEIEPRRREAGITATTKPSAAVQGKSARQMRQAFEATKYDLAASFLKELDDTITQGKLAELAASTGGVKINWTNKLNTSAGRAHWKRETIRSRPDTQGQPGHIHHASIDVAEKVIDDEHRLLNVIAHEFCHLANFMISGVTGNPHGKEFKSWASKCSQAFAGRGIDVTTKHSYDIAFKYIWQCTSCQCEYKRHSKSIDPERHRCGKCAAPLRQTKPTPRVGAKAGKISEYQMFVREQMSVLRSENPTIPQKDIMRLVAQRWAESPQKRASIKGAQGEKTTAQGITDQLKALSLDSGA